MVIDETFALGQQVPQRGRSMTQSLPEHQGDGASLRLVEVAMEE